jgi:hypothetical protein
MREDVESQWFLKGVNGSIEPLMRELFVTQFPFDQSQQEIIECVTSIPQLDTLRQRPAGSVPHAHAMLYDSQQLPSPSVVTSVR